MHVADADLGIYRPDLLSAGLLLCGHGRNLPFVSMIRKRLGRTKNLHLDGEPGNPKNHALKL